MPIVHFIDKNVLVPVEKGATILEAARKANIMLESPCNAMGTCGKCKVQLPLAQLSNIRQNESKHHVSAEEAEQGVVLSCQSHIYGDIEVKFYTQNQNKTLKILSEGKSFEFKIKNFIKKKFNGKNTLVFGKGEKLGVEDGNTENQNYGLAVDIGTTTVVASLIDVMSGEEKASVSALNTQSLTAQDVLSRIQFASSDDGLAKMYRDITDQINSMIAELEVQTGISHTYIYEVIYSGNTTMIHLAVNVNPKSLGKFPYTPAVYGGNSLLAVEYGVAISPFGYIYLPPIISAYVGPDITSGVLACQLDKTKGTALFIDIGTNGEMVLAKDGALFATSTAAGPAFEGMNISCGMRANKGAIEFFEIDEKKINIKTIGDAAPVGICGSGLLDIVGELVHVGVIGANGKFVSPDKEGLPTFLASHLLKRDGKVCFEVAENIYLTQKDIRQVQLAKGAVRAGVEALLEKQTIDASKVDVVEIAGSFGYHLRANSLINIGLLPPQFEGKVLFVGNTSKSGARAFLLNYNFRETIKEIVKKIGVVELGNTSDFERLFVKCLSF